VELRLSNEVNRFSIAAASADRILREISEQQFRGPEGSPLDNIDTECRKLRTAIMERTLRGDLTTVDDVLLLDEQLGAERRKRIAEDVAKVQRCQGKSDKLKLFRVENRAGRSIKIAAIDEDCARMFASYSGHVQEAKNAKVFVYKEEWLQLQKQSGSAIWKALKEGVPGVLKEVGNHVIIESRAKVYTPLSPVAMPDPRFKKD
jgi:hypothetical protein